MPKYLLLENVKELVSKKFKPDFERWLEFLDSLGYQTYWDLLNTKNFCLPQNNSYSYAGSNLSIEIDNTGNLRTSCVITCEGLTDTPTFRIMQDEKIIDQARYHLIIPVGSRLEIDSAPDTQRAELISPATGSQVDDTIENVYYAGEKDYSFSNFLMIPSGKSEFVASALNNAHGKVSIKFSYQREVI